MQSVCCPFLFQRSSLRIVILAINYAPEIIGCAVYTTDMAVRLAARGHDVTVIAAHPYYPEWTGRDGYPKARYRREVASGGVELVHCPHYIPANPSGLKRILHHASFAVTALPAVLRAVLSRRADVVFCVAPALLAAPTAWLGAKISHATSWLHIQDYEVEAAFATGLLKGSSRAGRVALAFENFILKRFDKVSSISGPMMAKLAQKGIPADRQYELRNWADLSQVRPLDGPSPLKAELGITEPHVVLYSGNIANKQGLEIIPAAARILAHRSDLTFVISGAGSYLEELKRLSAGLSNIRFYPLQPRDRLGDLVGMADIHLLPQMAGAADLVLPSKLTNMLASGRPVIATAAPGTALAEEVAGCGAVTEPGNATALAASIKTLLDDPDLRQRYGAAARQRALQRWDGNAILDRLEQHMLATGRKSARKSASS